MNKIILVGRLTKDPEVRSTSAGFTTVNFTVAVSRNFKKGSLIGIEGRVQTRNYDAQDGTKRYITEVVVENTEFVGGKNENSSNSSNDNTYVDAPSEAPIDVMPEYDIPASDPYENYDKEVSLSDNDLPF